MRTGTRKRPTRHRVGVAPFRILNIGNSTPVPLMTYLDLLQEALGRKAEMNFIGMQPGEVKDTWADTTDLTQATGYTPQTPVQTGIANFRQVVPRVLQASGEIDHAHSLTIARTISCDSWCAGGLPGRRHERTIERPPSVVPAAAVPGARHPPD